jgi:hypothetical protein
MTARATLTGSRCYAKTISNNPLYRQYYEVFREAISHLEWLFKEDGRFVRLGRRLSSVSGK